MDRDRERNRERDRERAGIEANSKFEVLNRRGSNWGLNRRAPQTPGKRLVYIWLFCILYTDKVL